MLYIRWVSRLSFPLPAVCTYIQLAVALSSFGFKASSRKRLKKHVKMHIYVYLCRRGFSSFWLYSVHKHAKTCLSTDKIDYRVDMESFHDWKVCCWCSLVEHPGLRPTSEENSHQRTHRYTKGWEKEDVWNMDKGNIKLT